MQLALEAARRKRTSASSTAFLDFKLQTWRGYEHTRHQAAIDEALDGVTRWLMSGGREGHGRLMVMMPPRHGKTENLRHYAAWLLGQMPELRLITTSYTTDLAYKNSRRTRNLIDSEAYRRLFPDVRISQTRAAVKEWELDGHAGAMIAAGVGSGITGHGGNLIIIDDPVKSRAEAESAVYRQRAKDWYANDLRTRLETPGAIIVNQTRWHQDDLAGWLLSDDLEGWRVLRLPALAEADDPLGRAPGEALWPERFDEATLGLMRAQMGEYAFSALYQQSPLPSGGGLFDPTQIRIVETVPECTRVVRFYDLAVTAKATSDYTVGLKLGVTKDNAPVILHVWRERRELPDVHEAIVQNAAVDGRDVAVRLEAEKAGIIQLQYLLRDPRMNAYVVDAKPPEGDKYTRAAPIAARVNAGAVMMVRGTWNAALLDELAVFPLGAHDDQVDALSGAWDMIADRGPLIAFEV